MIKRNVKICRMCSLFTVHEEGMCCRKFDRRRLYTRQAYEEIILNDDGNVHRSQQCELLLYHGGNGSLPSGRHIEVCRTSGCKWFHVHKRQTKHGIDTTYGCSCNKFTDKRHYKRLAVPKHCLYTLEHLLWRGKDNGEKR